jgi:proliferating cell nuclear antigen
MVLADGSYTYTHVTLDPSTLRPRPKSPGINLPASVVIDAKEFSEVIKSMAVIGDKIRMGIKGSALEISTEGDTDKLVKEIKCQEGHANVVEAKSLYSIDYLKDVAKAMKDAANITVHMNDNHPVRFDFEIEGMECSYMIAPRIEAD